MTEIEIILRKTSGGLDIFVHYLGKECLKPKFRSPFREDDIRPSCKLYCNQKPGGLPYYYLQDFGDGRFSGNCFAVAGLVLGINPQMEFVRLLKAIDQDMCLGVFGDQHDASRLPIKGTCNEIRIIPSPKKDGLITFATEEKTFSQDELSYWEHYGISEDTLQKYHVRSLKSCLFTNPSGGQYGIYSTALTPCYGYFFDGDQGLKVDRPRSENRFLYAGKLPSPYLFGKEQLPSSGEYVIVTGGEKDVLALAAHGFPAICLNSETAKMHASIMDDLARRFSKIIFLYDTDSTGKAESSSRVRELKDKYPVAKIDLPLPGSKQSKDVSDFFAGGGNSENLWEMLHQVDAI